MKEKKAALPLLVSLLLAVILTVSAVPLKAAAANQETDFTITGSGNTCTITGYTGTEKNVVIPDTINGKRVTKIGNSAFSRKGLTSVRIPYGVTVIGDSAFSMNQITTLKIPGSVRTVEAKAFMGCAKLTSVVFMYGIETIGDGAFASCISLTSVTMADSLSDLAGNMFGTRRNATVEIKANPGTAASEFTPTGSMAPAITDTPMEPNNICNYDYDMDEDGNIIIKGYYGQGSNIELLVPSAEDFGGNEILEIAAEAFRNKTDLYKADFSGSSLRTIGPNAFAGCTGLVELILPDTITAVGDNAFACGDREEGEELRIKTDSDAVIEYILNNGESIRFVPYNPGLSCYHELTIKVSGNGKVVLGRSGIYKAGSKMKIAAQPNKGYELTGWTTSSGGIFDIPEDAEKGDNSQATAFTMPDHDVVLTAVFKEKKRPDWVIIDGVVQEFNLQGEMNIPVVFGKDGEDTTPLVTTTAIGSNPFYYGGRPTKVTIPAGIKTIAQGAFDSSNCYGLDEFYVVPDNENFSSQDGVLFNKDKTVLIRYPKGKKGASYTIPGTVTSIANGAFYDCNYLESVVIPLGVTVIPYQAFESCNALKEVTIEGAITKIESYAFAYCGRLESFTIQGTITSIGTMAFYSSGLKEVTIPAGVASIGDGAFSACSMLTKITVNANNSNFKDIAGVLYNKTETRVMAYPCLKDGTEYTIPDGVTDIAYRAFECCNRLEKVSLGSGLKTVEYAAFESCGNLTEVDFAPAAQLETIGGSAFELCRKLTETVIPESVTSIGSYAFGYCDGFTKAVIPKNVTSIGYNAFYFCKNITEFEVAAGNTAYKSDAAGALLNKAGTELIAYPIASARTTYEAAATVERIQSYAFAFNTTLKAVRLPESVETVEDYAFYSCTGLKALEMRNPSVNIYYSTYSHALSGTPTANLVLRGYAYQKKADGTADESTVGTVRSYAKRYGYKFQQLEEVSAGLTINKDGAVTGYSGTDTAVVLPNVVVIPENANQMTTTGYDSEYTDLEAMAGDMAGAVEVKAIGTNAFNGKNITEVKYNDKLETIEAYAFDGCNQLTEAVIPASVTSIAPEAFVDCERFVKFIVDADNQVYASVYDGILANKDKTIIKLVPTAYSGTEGVLTLNQLGTNDELITGIADGAFYGNTGLNKIEIRDVEYIGVSAFKNAFTNPSHLVEVELQGVKGINDHAFDGCSGLKKVTLDATLEHLGSGVFTGCTSLEEVDVNPINPLFETVAGAVYSKASSKFNKQLIFYPAGKTDSSYTIADGTVGIACGAFSNAQVTQVIVPDSVVNIGERAFDSCTRLTEIILYNNLQEIGAYAFAGCSNLVKAVIPGSVSTIGAGAFQGCYALKDVEIYNPDLVLTSVVFESMNDAFTIYSVNNSIVSQFAADRGFNFAELTADQLANPDFGGTVVVNPASDQEVPEEEQTDNGQNEGEQGNGGQIEEPQPESGQTTREGQPEATPDSEDASSLETDEIAG